MLLACQSSLTAQPAALCQQPPNSACVLAPPATTHRPPPPTQSNHTLTMLMMQCHGKFEVHIKNVSYKSGQNISAIENVINILFYVTPYQITLNVTYRTVKTCSISSHWQGLERK